MIIANSGRWVIVLAGSLSLGVVAMIISTPSISAQTPCTMDCGSLAPTCVGTDQSACNWYCVDCANCSGQQSGVTWFNVSTRGSTTGSNDISWTSVNCRVVKPCVNAPPIANMSCSGAIPCFRSCKLSFGQSCSYCGAGTGTLLTVSSCNTIVCGSNP